MTLDEFLDNPLLRNEWIAEKNIRVYIRRSVRYINEKMTPALDVGSVEVDEGKRGQKVFTEFLRSFEAAAKCAGRIVYVESILEPRLVPFLARMGYKFVPDTAPIAPSMYKIV